MCVCLQVQCLLPLSDYQELEIPRDILLTPPPKYKIYENESIWLQDFPGRRTDLKNAFLIPANTFSKAG